MGSGNIIFLIPVTLMIESDKHIFDHLGLVQKLTRTKEITEIYNFNMADDTETRQTVGIWVKHFR